MTGRRVASLALITTLLDGSRPPTSMRKGATFACARTRHVHVPIHKQCALTRTLRPPHPHCGHTHVPSSSTPSPHPSHVQHRPLFRCGAAPSTSMRAPPAPPSTRAAAAQATSCSIRYPSSLCSSRPQAPLDVQVVPVQAGSSCTGSSWQVVTLPYGSVPSGSSITGFL